MTQQNPAAPQKEQYPAPAMHYKATGPERKRLHGYSGRLPGPACNTGDGHWKAAPVASMVNCPRCLIQMQRLHITLNDFQKTILEKAKVKA